jgi:hypothetical protein
MISAFFPNEANKAFCFQFIFLSAWECAKDSTSKEWALRLPLVMAQLAGAEGLSSGCVAYANVEPALQSQE